MGRKLIAIGFALLLTAFSVSSAAASKVHIKGGVSFSLGSLIASGTLAGLGKTDVKVLVNASGIPVVMCTTPGGNQAPGQNPAVSASGLQLLPGNDPLRKNGTSPFRVETSPPPALSATQGGCPNDNWTATITFVYWTDATVSVLDSATQAVLLTQNYECVTTTTTVTCTPKG